MNEQKQEQNFDQNVNGQNQSGNGMSPLMDSTGTKSGKGSNKKGKMIATVVVALLVIIIAGASMIILNTSVRNQIFMSALSPKEYYLKTEISNIEKKAKQIADSYGKQVELMEAQKKKTMKNSVALKVSVDDTYTSMLGLDTLFPLELNTGITADLKNSAEQVDMELKLGGESFIGANMFMNIGKEKYGDTYIQIPQISSAYLFTSMQDMAKEKENENVDAYFNSLKKFYGNYLDKPTSKTLVAELISKYGKTVCEGLKDVKLEKNVKYTVSGTAKKATKVAITITEKDAQKMLEKLVDTASKDKKLKKELVRLEACTEKEYEKGIEKLKKAIDETEKEEAESNNTVVMNVWIDKQGNILGRDFSSKGDGEENASTLYYHMLSNGKTDYFEAGATGNDTDDFVLTGNRTKEKKGYKGDIIFTSKEDKESENSVKLSFDEVALVDEEYGSYNGNFTLEYNGDSMVQLEDSNIKLTLNGGEKEQKAVLEAILAGQSVGKIEYSQNMKECDKVSYPPKGESYSINNAEQLEKYKDTIDQDAVRALEEKVESFVSLFGSLLGLDSSTSSNWIGGSDNTDSFSLEDDDSLDDFSFDDEDYSNDDYNIDDYDNEL